MACSNWLIPWIGFELILIGDLRLISKRESAEAQLLVSLCTLLFSHSSLNTVVCQALPVTVPSFFPSQAVLQVHSFPEVRAVHSLNNTVSVAIPSFTAS